MRKWILAYSFVGLIWASFAAERQYEFWPQSSPALVAAGFVANAILWPVSVPLAVWREK